MSKTDVSAILNDYLGTYKRLLQLAHKKQQALIANDNGRLAAIVAGEEALLSHLSELDAEVRPYLQGDGPAGDRDGLTRELLGEIQDTVAELRRISRENMALARQALRYVQWALKVIHGAEAKQSMYGSDGALEVPGPLSPVVDQKV